jgi:hypothetical protein
MWFITLIENIIFFSIKAGIWIFLHWYAFFGIIALILLYEFWWKRRQEIKKSQFIIGDSKNKQNKNKN